MDLERSLNDSIRSAKQTKESLEGRLKTEKSNFDKDLKEQRAKNAEAICSIQKKMQAEIAEQIEASNLQLQVRATTMIPVTIKTTGLVLVCYFIFTSREMVNTINLFFCIRFFKKIKLKEI